MNELVTLKDTQLLEKFGSLVNQEREMVSEVVLHLSEIDKRKLYAQQGYSSLFSYCVEKYHYSEGAAYRRIQASKVYQKFPHILELLKEGKVNLMTLSLIEPHLDPENGRALIDKVLGKSKRKVEEILLELSLKKEKTQDIIRRLPIKKAVLGNGVPLAPKGALAPFGLGSFGPKNFTFTGESKSEEAKSTENMLGHKEADKALELCLPISDTGKNKVQEIRRVKIEFVAEEAVAQMIERAKELLRHKYPEGKLEDLVREAFELLLEKKDPKRKIQKQEKKEILQVEPAPGKQAGTQSKTRYVSQAIRRKIWQRDHGQCSYESFNGRRCHEKAGLELDHIEPFALGGQSSEENLRLLCKTHNQWRAEKTFGVLYKSKDWGIS